MYMLHAYYFDLILSDIIEIIKKEQEKAWQEQDKEEMRQQEIQLEYEMKESMY